jgi:hypothetical protein
MSCVFRFFRELKAPFSGPTIHMYRLSKEAVQQLVTVNSEHVATRLF